MTVMPLGMWHMFSSFYRGTLNVRLHSTKINGSTHNLKSPLRDFQYHQVATAITDVISQFPTPTSHTDLHTFIRLANQLASSTNTLASLLTPLQSIITTQY